MGAQPCAYVRMYVYVVQYMDAAGIAVHTCCSCVWGGGGGGGGVQLQ